MDFLTRVPSSFSTSFSEALRIETGGGSWYFISGQVGVPYDDGPKPRTFADEVRICFDRIRESLEKLGVTLEHVVKIQAYLTDLAPYADYSRIRAAIFAKSLPTSTAVQVAGLLLGARIEIDAVAFAPTV